MEFSSIFISIEKFVKKYQLMSSEWMLEFMIENDIEPVVFMGEGVVVYISSSLSYNKVKYPNLMTRVRHSHMQHARGYFVSKEECKKILESGFTCIRNFKSVLLYHEKENRLEKVNSYIYANNLNKSKPCCILQEPLYTSPEFYISKHKSKKNDYFDNKLDFIQHEDFVKIERLNINRPDVDRLKRLLEEKNTEKKANQPVPIVAKGPHISSMFGQLVNCYNNFREYAFELPDEDRKRLSYSDACSWVRKELLSYDSIKWKNQDVRSAAARFAFGVQSEDVNEFKTGGYLIKHSSNLIKMIELLEVNYENINNNFSRKGAYEALIEKNFKGFVAKPVESLATIIVFKEYKQGGTRR